MMNEQFKNIHVGFDLKSYVEEVEETKDESCDSPTKLRSYNKAASRDFMFRSDFKN